MKYIYSTVIRCLCLLQVLCFASCRDGQTSNTVSSWKEIEIRLDGQTITILNFVNQSGGSRIYVPQDTVYELSFSRGQLDSIYNYVSSIIENPPVPDHLVAAQFSEIVSIEVLYENEVARSTKTKTSKLIEFQYITSWKLLSPDTKGLSELLARNVRMLK